MRELITTTLEDIYKYWSNRVIIKDGTTMLFNEMKENGIYNCDDYVFPLIDSGEPECFVCGTSMDRFERAHIVPMSLGGKDEPSNYVPLCPRCHRNAPNTTDRSAFMRYIFREQKSQRWCYGIERKDIQHIADVANELNISTDEVCEILKDASAKDIQLTNHFGDSINQASWVAYIEHCLYKKSKR